MLGYGRIGIEPDETGQEGSLSHAVKEKGLYPYLIDEAGNWTGCVMKSEMCKSWEVDLERCKVWSMIG